MLDANNSCKIPDHSQLNHTRPNLTNRFGQVEYVEDLEEDESDIEDAAEWGDSYWGSAVGGREGEGGVEGDSNGDSDVDSEGDGDDDDDEDEGELRIVVRGGGYLFIRFHFLVSSHYK